MQSFTKIVSEQTRKIIYTYGNPRSSSNKLKCLPQN